jgi:transcriptional regulator with PAS, ATPase and Fis domain
MSAVQQIPLDRLADLRAVRALSEIAHRRWRIGLSLVTPDGSVHPPGHSFASTQAGADQLRQQVPGPGVARVLESGGVREIAAPIAVDDTCTGWVLASGFVENSATLVPDPRLVEAADRLPSLNPVEQDVLREMVETAAGEIARFQTAQRRAAPTPARSRYPKIIGASEPMQHLFRLLDKVVESDSTVLIQGENGTGKELIAKAIHANSSRRDRPFVVQNCSAFNDNLLDSELFGHKRGSFTGAVVDKRGLFEVADGGTFFLDEIGDMSAALQVKLLRVLQEGTFIPVGDTQTRRVDVRIIAATNRDLKDLMERGVFREDLYYRINVINIVPPALRERRADILPLVEHFLANQAKTRDEPPKRLTRACVDRLLAHHWPGNVRELENEIERLVVLSGDESPITEELLSSRIRAQDQPAPEIDNACLPDAVMNLERNMIYEVLKRNQWNKTRAARELQISRRNLIRKVHKYKLDRQRPG